MAHEEFHNAPVNVVLSSLAGADDIAQVKIPGATTVTITEISAACRALTSGTATLIVKNNAGSTVTSINLATGAPVTGSLSIGTIAGGDRLRFGLTGLGVGLVDVSVVAWLKMPSTA